MEKRHRAAIQGENTYRKTGAPGTIKEKKEKDEHSGPKIRTADSARADRRREGTNELKRGLRSKGSGHRSGNKGAGKRSLNGGDKRVNSKRGRSVPARIERKGTDLTKRLNDGTSKVRSIQRKRRRQRVLRKSFKRQCVRGHIWERVNGMDKLKTQPQIGAGRPRKKRQKREISKNKGRGGTQSSRGTTALLKAKSQKKRRSGRRFQKTTEKEETEKSGAQETGKDLVGNLKRELNGMESDDPPR